EFVMIQMVAHQIGLQSDPVVQTVEGSKPQTDLPEVLSVNGVVPNANHIIDRLRADPDTGIEEAGFIAPEIEIESPVPHNGQQTDRLPHPFPGKVDQAELGSLLPAGDVDHPELKSTRLMG